MSDKAVFRTAPATQGLLNILLAFRLSCCRKEAKGKLQFSAVELEIFGMPHILAR